MTIQALASQLGWQLLAIFTVLCIIMTVLLGHVIRHWGD